MDGAAGLNAGEPGAGDPDVCEAGAGWVRVDTPSTAEPGAVSEAGGVKARAAGIGTDGGLAGRGAAGDAEVDPGIGCLGPVRI